MKSCILDEILLATDEIQVALFFGKTLQLAFALAQAFFRFDNA